MKYRLHPDQGSMFAYSPRGFPTCFIVVIEDHYKSKVGHEDSKPDTVFREMATLADELSNVFKTGLTPRQGSAFVNHILQPLA